MAHYDDWGVIAHGILNGHPADRVAMKGNASEVARTFYGGPDGPPATGAAADILALIPGWAEIPFIAASIEEWHQGAAAAAAASGIALDDLFYWEHRCGSWQSQSQLEWDIAQETFTPFSNRILLGTLLGVPAAERADHGNTLLREIIRAADPAALRVPINPRTPYRRAVEFGERLRHRARRELRRLRTR
ncbi:hypothetical protein ATY41_11375 [Leifsonia xyli subsp. xyli]|uniref:Uncharacterized protein n=2 Tax=Leifsonia xyli subsp. xyli TaxID=59736 RepID=Q6AGD5_LEIXX|nr:hypothetical protein [Leifsonia xyli]AAT88560.1 hypothetical protein Lxx06000 [Leifsonia xyli subsp. xyli str. CTCB07]ODA90146.1 hypothetical protein ATY41_11375 [Leifsonia xyli subsp. xyli]